MPKSKLEQLKTLVDKFEAAQVKYDHFGAGDSEPRTVFCKLLAAAQDGLNPECPISPEGWQLYDRPGAKAAARSLGAAAKRCVELIKRVPLGEAAAARAFLGQYF